MPHAWVVFAVQGSGLLCSLFARMCVCACAGVTMHEQTGSCLVVKADVCMCTINQGRVLNNLLTAYTVQQIISGCALVRRLDSTSASGFPELQEVCPSTLHQSSIPYN